MINKLFAFFGLNYNLLQINAFPLYFIFIFRRRLHITLKKLAILLLIFALLIFSDNFIQAAFLFTNILIVFCFRVYPSDILVLWYLLILSCLVAYLDKIVFNSFIASYLYVDGNGTHSGILGLFELYRFGAFFSEPSRLALITVMILYLTHLYKVYSNWHLLIAIPIIVSTVSLSGLILFVLFIFIILNERNAPQKVKIFIIRSAIFIILFATIYLLYTIWGSKFGSISLFIENEPRILKIKRALLPILRGEIFLIPGFFNYVSLYNVNVGNWALLLVHDYRLIGIVLLGIILVNLYIKLRFLGMLFVLVFYSMQSENHLIFIAPLIWIFLHERKYIS